MFSEVVQYSHARSDSIHDLEKKCVELFEPKAHTNRLAEMGYRVGVRVFEMTALREKGFKREIKLNGLLLFIQTTIWKVL